MLLDRGLGVDGAQILDVEKTFAKCRLSVRGGGERQQIGNEIIT